MKREKVTSMRLFPFFLLLVSPGLLQKRNDVVAFVAAREIKGRMARVALPVCIGFVREQQTYRVRVAPIVRRQSRACRPVS